MVLRKDSVKEEKSVLGKGYIGKSRKGSVKEEKGDIGRAIASRENLALKKPKEISGYLPFQNPPCSIQVDPNTKAIRQLLEVIKHAKKTLAKKPGSGREKADKIHIDHFLDEVLKNIGDDSDPN
ncbi:11659_t:CDS:2, partial [Gigaspora margarita]